MAMQEFTGTIHEVGKTQTFHSKTPGKSPFYKRSIVVKEEGSGNYDNLVEFTATGADKCKELDAWAPGDEVKVGFFINGRPWYDPKTDRTRYFMDLKIAKIEVNGFCRREEDARVAQEKRQQATVASVKVPGEIAQAFPGARLVDVQAPQQDDMEDLPF